MIYVGENRDFKKLSDTVGYVTAGDTIFIDEGIYTETSQVFIPPDVDINGIGNVVINISYEASNPEDAFLILKSGRLEGNKQKISNITFDGEFNSGICALVWKRNNVVFDNCIIKNFTKQGIQYKVNTWFTEPSEYATGNIVRNCIFRDCSRRITEFGQGAIWCQGQNGFLVHDNEFYLEDMPAGQNGNMMMLSWVKGFKYYNNISWKSYDEAGEYNMGIELWNSLGGNEVYNNTFNGGGTSLDIAGVNNTKGEYDFSWWIHHNEFIMDSQGAIAASGVAVSFEANNSDAIVEYNRVINLGKFLVITQSASVSHNTRNINIRYNLCENIGNTDFPYGAFISLINYNEGDVIENIYIHNNTFKGEGSSSGIRAYLCGSLENVFIYNNIIEGIKNYGVSGTYFGWLIFENYAPPHLPISVENIFIRNNIIYDNVNNNDIYYYAGVVVNNLVEENTINDTPEFVLPYTDFHLKGISPAIEAGININIDLDFDGNIVGEIPCIGVYEYIS